MVAPLVEHLTASQVYMDQILSVGVWFTASIEISYESLERWHETDDFHLRKTWTVVSLYHKIRQAEKTGKWLHYLYLLHYIPR